MKVKKKIVLQNIETKKYFGTYGMDDYWTENINEAEKFKDSSDFNIDEQSIDFLNESNIQIVEIIQFGKTTKL